MKPKKSFSNIFKKIKFKLKRNIQITENTSYDIAMDESVSDNFTINDTILILLISIDRKIIGRLMFVKEAFLLTKRYFPKIFSELNFYPSYYGPYSRKLINSAKELKIENLIQIDEAENKYGTITYTFSLTDQGRINANEAFNKLSPIIKEKIKMNRIAWDRLGYNGILKYVYSEFPEYTTNSKIADQV